MPVEQRVFGPIVPVLIEIYGRIDPRSVQEPPHQVDEERDMVVGVMDDNHRRIYALYRSSLDQLQEVLERGAVQNIRHFFANNEENGAKYETVVREFDNAADQMAIMGLLLVVELKRKFPALQGKRNIGVRAGFQVVYEKESGLSSIDKAASQVLEELRTKFERRGTNPSERS